MSHRGYITPDSIDQYWIEGKLIEIAEVKSRNQPTSDMYSELCETVLESISEGRCLAPKTCARLALEGKEITLEQCA